MKLLTKLIITVSSLTAVTAGAVSAHEINKARAVTRSFEEGTTYEVSSHGYDMKVDTKSLYFEISKNGPGIPQSVQNPRPP